MLWRGGAPRRRGRILERRVRREARAPVFLRVVDLEHHRLVAPHLREVEPAVPRAVLQPVGLPHAVRVAALGDQEIVGLDALGVGDGERIGLDRLVDRPPDLDDREAALQQLFAFVCGRVHAPGAGPTSRCNRCAPRAPARAAAWLRARPRCPSAACGRRHGRVLRPIGSGSAPRLRGNTPTSASRVEEIAHRGPVLDEDEAVLIQRELGPGGRRAPPSHAHSCVPLVLRWMLFGPKVSLTSFSPVATVYGMPACIP